MKVAIYCRVSTTEQDALNQLLVLEKWAKDRGFEVHEVYREQATAWKDGHQKELARLILDAQRGQFQYVMVWSLDRLSREGALKILELVNKLNRWEVKILSYQEPWTEAPGELGEVLYALVGWVAKMESQRRSERTKAGMERAKAEGVHVGRPSKVVYYDPNGGMHYHRRMDCPAVKNSPFYKSISLVQLKKIVTQSGSEYRPCPLCMRLSKKGALKLRDRF